MKIKYVSEVVVTAKVGNIVKYVGEDCQYFTKGKMYPIIKVNENSIEIIDDDANLEYFHELTKELFEKGFKVVQL